MLSYTLLVAALFANTINLTAAKLNEARLVGLGPELSEVQKFENEKVTAYFDETLNLLNKLFKEYKEASEKLGDFVVKGHNAVAEKKLNEEANKLKADTSYEKKGTWKPEDYTKYFAACETTYPKLYAHVREVKKHFYNLLTEKNGEAGKFEFGVRTVQEYCALKYQLVKNLVELSKKRLEELDPEDKKNLGDAYVKELEENEKTLKAKHDEVAAVKTYDEVNLKKVTTAYEEFNNLVGTSSVTVNNLFALAHKALAAKSKQATLTFFEQHARGFLGDSSSAFLNVISSHFVLITVAVFALANL